MVPSYCNRLISHSEPSNRFDWTPTGPASCAYHERTTVSDGRSVTSPSPSDRHGRHGGRRLFLNRSKALSVSRLRTDRLQSR